MPEDVHPSYVWLEAGAESVGTIGLDEGTESIGTVGLDAGTASIGTVGLDAGTASIGTVGLNAGTAFVGKVAVMSPGNALTNSSGNKENASAVATLTGAADKTVYISGFDLTAAGATGVLVVTATVTGVVGGPLSYTFTFPTGADVAASPLHVTFPTPVPATAVNTPVVVTLPASGAGGLFSTSSAYGFEV